MTRRRSGGTIAGVVLAAAIAGCGTPANRTSDTTRTRSDSAAGGALRLTDDAGHVVTLAHPARRIISLIPCVTETLVSLGLSDRIVGRTRYDVDPHVMSAPLVGGGIDPSIETIVGLRPDLVITWSNDKRELTRNKLASLGMPVFTVRTEDTTDVFRTIHSLGRLTGRDAAATALSASLRDDLDSVRASVAGKPAPKVLWVVYNDPPMTAGPKTFIGQLMALAGGRSIFDDSRELWPNVALEEVVCRQPDVIVIPVGEFKNQFLSHLRSMPGWRDLRAIREGHVVEVPADLVSRPGPHMGEAARVMRAAFHPEFASPVHSAARRK